MLPPPGSLPGYLLSTPHWHMEAFLEDMGAAPCLFLGGQRMSVLATVVVINTDTVLALRGT